MTITGRGAVAGVCIFFAATCASAAELTLCGSKWYQRLGLQVLEVEQATRGGYSFNTACKVHDACYAECNSLKTVCDTQLLTDAERVCESVTNRANCLADAQLFYIAVSKNGGDPFRQAQASCKTNPSLNNPTSAAVGSSSLAQDTFARLLAAAEGGDSASQLRVGVKYATGDGVRVNGSEAVRWLERAAASNGKTAATAAGWLGVVYERGMGVRKSGETAVRWYTRGAELGSGTSAQNLGELYLAGNLVTKNETLGYEWYARAAKLYEADATAGDASAAYQAGRIYHRGMGVSPDRAKAIALYEIASAAGNADATRLLNEIRAQPRGGVAAAPANPAQSRAADPSCGDDVKQCVTNTFIKLRGNLGGNMDQLTITNSAQARVTGADRANGITEKWCVNVYYVLRHSSYTNGRWEDRYQTILVVRDQGALKANLHMNYSGKESEAAESFARCLRNDPPA